LYTGSHPNVVQINFAAQDNDNIYISMPYYMNKSLSYRMKHVNFTAREIIRYSIQFLSGLHHIHTKGLMHFDIKPNNLMLSDRDEALLADFGLAEVTDLKLRAAPQMQYTTHIAPEYFTENSFSFTYDIYQAGMTIYRMAVGDEQFTDECNQLFTRGNVESDIRTGIFPSKKYEPHIPRKLQKVINKCLESNPNDRYQSVLDILNDLSSIDDCCLDWRPVKIQHGKGWEKSSDGYKYTFTVADGNTECYRLNSKDQRRKYSAMCQTGVNDSMIYRLLNNN
ncbi:hypothetical protein AI29_16035, partial [bacteria symbiont BFo2 of Frankliniella occidentalis]